MTLPLASRKDVRRPWRRYAHRRQRAVKWGRGGNSAFLDLLEIQVDRADTKDFVLLTYDTTSGYNDTAPLPATAAKWKYRAIYRVADARVGVWSDEVSITVGGRGGLLSRNSMTN